MHVAKALGAETTKEIASGFRSSLAATNNTTIYHADEETRVLLNASVVLCTNVAKQVNKMYVYCELIDFN